jgi:D-alanyl-D-alanine carboxypeptidase
MVTIEFSAQSAARALRLCMAVCGIVTSLTLAPVATAQSNSSLGEDISAYAAAHDFSGTILVRRGGQDEFEQSYGLANRALAVPAKNDTLYRIASVTKLFTSVIVMQLVDEGRIDLDKPVSHYLPTYGRNGAGDIPIRNLLNHTSGLANIDTITSYQEAVTQGMPVYQLPHTPQQLLEQYASGPPVRAPGAAFDYNNADYIVLGEIVEAVTGKSFEATLAQRLIEPLGLHHTGMMAQPRILPGLADTYFRPDDASAFRNDLPVYWENWYAAAGMYSTVRDLAQFADALYGRRLMSQNALEQMLTPGLDGYGFGLWAWEIEVTGRRYRTAERFGSSMGANAVVFRVHDAGLTVIILANSNATDMRDFAVFIANQTIVAEGAE